MKNKLSLKSICENHGKNDNREITPNEFSLWGEETHYLIIPVTEASFGPIDPFPDKQLFETKASFYDADDRCAYLIEIPEYIIEGYVEVYAKATKFGLIEITKCIQEGYHGDSDGFGVEPDTWIKTYLNHRGEFVSPFSLFGSKANRNIENLLAANINPVDEKGKIKIYSLDRV